jgi:hypothetical protein
VFVSKLNAQGTQLSYSTYLGGSGIDQGRGIAVDSSGTVSLTGATTSTNFPTVGPLQASNAGGYDAFVSRLNAVGTQLSYSTFLGGPATESGTGVALDSGGNIYLAGYTSSSSFPTANALQAAHGGAYDAFVLALAAPGDALVFSTFLGGSGDDQAYAIGVDGEGAVHVAGMTTSSSFPTANAAQASFGGDSDSFIAILVEGVMQPPTVPTNLRATGTTTTTVTLTWDPATDNVGVTSYDVYRGSALAGTSSSTTFTITGLQPNQEYSFTVRAKDAAGNQSAASTILTTRTLPQDPAQIAPPVNQDVATDLHAAIQFLYTGSDPIQTDVVANTIVITRVAVLRGRVLTRDGQPLPGVTITILDHPEFGKTVSRADGMFDMAVNGGGTLTVNYDKTGYLPAQRLVTTPWRDYLWVADAALVPLDSAVTPMTLSGTNTPQVARGTVVSDTDGVRQATLLFPANVTATMELADGTIQPLTSLHVRATEYTVGPNGPEAMPGPLPANTGYTYAAEFSVDEALAAGATDVRFSKPLPVYVENFIGFPVGGIVPAGYYDRSCCGKWIASHNGRVIKIISVMDGKANLDITGDGVADDAASLGVTETERQQLATLYSAGQELWRVPISHFTPWDFNWPYGPPDDAVPPPTDPPIADEDDECDCLPGSVIRVQRQTLGEMIEVTGAPLDLHYNGDRVEGRTAASTLEIPVSGSTIPESVERIEVEVTVAGRHFTQVVAPEVNQSTTFRWDGVDAYGRESQGGQPVSVRVTYVYPIEYQRPDDVEQSFGRFGNGTPIQVSRQTAEVTLSQEWRGSIGLFDAQEQGLGGWTLSAHHVYDPVGQILYLGDGTRRSTQDSSDRIITTVAGNGGTGAIADGGAATETAVNSPTSAAVGPDGSIYFTTVYHIRRDCVIHVGGMLACLHATSACPTLPRGRRPR